MAGKNRQSYQVIWLIRRLFRALARETEHYLPAFGVTAAERAVLEFLDTGGPATVPAIARRHDVSRQHIQVNVNALLDKGLVRSVANPKHKRSRLVKLTAAGRDTFAAIRRHEHSRVARLFESVPDTALETTRLTLAALLNNLGDRSRP